MGFEDALHFYDVLAHCYDHDNNCAILFCRPIEVPTPYCNNIYKFYVLITEDDYLIGVIAGKTQSNEILSWQISTSEYEVRSGKRTS